MPKKPLLDQALRDAGRAFAAVALFSVAVNLLHLAAPLYMLQVYDRVLGTGSVETLIVLSAMVVVCLGLLAALDGLRSLIAQRIGAWVEARLTGPAVEAAVDRGLAENAATAQGVRDLAAVRAFLGSSSVFPAFDAPFAPLFILLLWAMHPWLGAMAAGGAVLLFLVALAAERVSRRPAGEAAAGSIEFTGETDRMVRNAETVAALGMLPAILRRLQRESGGWRGAQDRAAVRVSGLQSVAKGLRLILQSGILGLAAFLALDGVLSPGMLIAASVLLGRALAPVEQAIPAWKAWIGCRDALGRLRDLIGDRVAPSPDIALPTPAGHLTVEGVTVSIGKGTPPILLHVAFDIRAPEIVAIVGPSGAGKTTLMRCLAGIVGPTAGAVRMDGAEMSRLGPANRQRFVGYLPQGIELFDGTVRENIARFEDAGDEEVMAAARMAGVLPLILRLPNGFGTRIGRDGVPLSAGQRQRIALARAVFRSPRLILLDEPNANLDHAGEAELQATLSRLKDAGHAVAVITHRPRLLAAVDKVAVLKQGRLVDFGDRDAVLARLQGESGPPPPPGGLAAKRPTPALAAHRATAAAAE